jgi:hypothetical protein
MESFKRQLQETEKDAEETSDIYPGMSPEGRRECRERVEKTLETLSKIKKSLEEDPDPDARTLQVTVSKGKPSPEVITQAFTDFLLYPTCRRPNHPRDRVDIPIEKIFDEDTFVAGPGNKLHPIKEWFIVFTTVRSTEFVLGLEKIDIRGCGQTMFLSKPRKNPAKRAVYQTIGTLVARIEEINEELKNLGATRVDHVGKPTPANNYVDRSHYIEGLAQWKRARQTGTMLDHHAYAVLKHYKIVDKQKLQSRMDALYNEECDTLIKLREFQLSGYEFDF